MSDQVQYSSTGKPHPFHIVRPSIWPLVGAIVAGLMAGGMVLFMHHVEWHGITFGVAAPLLGLIMVLGMMFMWWKDIIHEAIVEKAHSDVTKISFRFGMMLFISSEVMFFVAFFWAFFSSAFYPAGGMWPPANIHTIDPFGTPFLMTLILLLSGCTVTWAHHEIIEGHKDVAAKALGITVLLGAAFMCFQAYEYSQAPFHFKDGIFPSTFFMATGFHGFHVMVGTIFLFVCWLRTKAGQFLAKSHFGFEAAAWYWHFVDVVWLFLFIAVYYWGGGDATRHAVESLV